MMRISILPLMLSFLGLTSLRSVAQVPPATQPIDAVRVRYVRMDPDEQKAVVDWMKAKMPNLARMVSALPDTGRPSKRNRLLNAAAARYRNYQQTKDTPAALEAVMKSVRLEDEIFGYIDQLDDAPVNRRIILQAQIREKTRALVDVFLADRADRIARLRARLDAEQKTLDADRAQANVLVDQRLAHFMVEAAPKLPDDSATPTTQP